MPLNEVGGIVDRVVAVSVMALIGGAVPTNGPGNQDSVAYGSSEPT
jgi:hypothetical protein